MGVCFWMGVPSWTDMYRNRQKISQESPKPASFSRNEYSGDVVFVFFSTAPAHGKMVQLSELGSSLGLDNLGYHASFMSFHCVSWPRESQISHHGWKQTYPWLRPGTKPKPPPHASQKHFFSPRCCFSRQHAISKVWCCIARGPTHISSKVQQLSNSEKFTAMEIWKLQSI